MDNYVSQREAARQLNLSRQAVSSAIKRGQLQAVTIAGRKILAQSEVDRYKKKARVPGWEGYWNKRKAAKSQEKKNVSA